MRRVVANAVSERLQALGQMTFLTYDGPKGYCVWAKGADWQAPLCATTKGQADALVRRLRKAGRTR